MPGKLANAVRREWRHWVILTLLGGFVLFYRLGEPSLWERDEPKYAEPGWRMVVTGDWLTPRFNGLPRFDKPPLFYWLEGGSFLLFGKTEWAARFPSALAGFGLLVLTYLVGRRILGSRAGLIAACVLATSPHFLLQCRLAVVDATLAFFLLTALWSLLELATPRDTPTVPSTPAPRNGNDQPHPGYLYLLAAAMALATLTKGPIGLILPLAAALLWRIFAFIRFHLPLRHLIGSALLLVLLLLPWYAAIAAAHGESFVSTFFLFHNVTRFLTPVDNHTGNLWFYLPTLLVGFFPWSFFLFLPHRPSGCPSGRSEGTSPATKAGLRLLLIWAVVVIGFFTVAKTKLGSYIFPVYPVLAILVSRFWERAWRNPSPRSTAGALDGTVPFVPLVLNLAIWATMFSLLPSLPELLRVAVVLTPLSLFTLGGAGFVGFTAAIALAERPRFARHAFTTLAGTMVLLFWLGVCLLVPVASRANPSKALAERLHQEGIAARDRVVLFQVASNGLVFYTGHPVHFIPPGHPAPAELVSASRPTFVILPKGEFPRLAPVLTKPEWRRIHETHGLWIYTNIDRPTALPAIPFPE